jgi:glycerophosphoryl diester phosphodiesterase
MGTFDRSPLIIGHRGAAGLVAENTLPSFLKAVETGVDAVELDVHLADGELIVIHDDTLDRTTNGRGELHDARLSDLRNLDAGNGAPIPLLKEVLEALPVEIGVNIELKGPGTGAPLAEFLPGDPGRDVLVSSFEHGRLRAFAAERPDIPVAPLYGRWRGEPLRTCQLLGARFLNIGRKLARADRLAAANAAGLKVLVYTVNDLHEARRLFEMGAWGVFTDFPDRVSRAAL